MELAAVPFVEVKVGKKKKEILTKDDLSILKRVPRKRKRRNETCMVS